MGGAFTIDDLASLLGHLTEHRRETRSTIEVAHFR